MFLSYPAEMRCLGAAECGLFATPRPPPFLIYGRTGVLHSKHAQVTSLLCRISTSQPGTLRPIS